MSEEICYAEAAELAARIRAGDLSPVEVARAHLERIEAVNPGINAVVTLADDALDRAREAEEAIARGDIRGPLHGVPFTSKDVFDTEGLRSTRGSRIFTDLVPDTDATAVRRLKEAGAILLGKTNLPEFALRAETYNELFDRTLNPWNRDRTPGGSSGGEAAAIAAGLSPLGIGTDMGGSNRLPSHYCGIVGFKATHGRIPLTGSWPALMCRYMHVGPIARSVRDVALALEVLSGPDGLDPYAVSGPALQLADGGKDLAGLRIGFFTEGTFAPVDPEIQAAVSGAAAALEERGCTLVPVSFDWADRLPIEVCMDIVVADCAHYFQPFVAGRLDELTEQIQGLLGAPSPSLEDYLISGDKVELLAADMAGFFAEHDLLLCPTSPTTAHGHDAETLTIGAREAEPGHAANITATFGLTGNPAISVPFSASREGLPIGVQLAAPHYDEATLLRGAMALEEAGAQAHPSV